MPHLDLPSGFAARPASLDDIEECTDLFNAADREFLPEGAPGWHSVEETRAEWTEPGFDLSTDTCVVIDRAGSIVAHQEVFTTPPHVRAIIWGKVHPDARGRGIGSALLEWAERRAHQMVSRAPDHAAFNVQAWIMAENAPAVSLLEDHGFTHSRYFHEMEIHQTEPPEPQEWAEGFELRPFDRSQYRQVRAAVRESFLDHWGFAAADPEEDFVRAAHHLDNHPHFDPDLFFVLWDGDEIAGVAECFPHADNDPNKGLVGVLGVRKQWRGRGLGLALLLHSFRAFWERGIKNVSLGVDADSLTGATRLYEKAGMHVTLVSATYDKLLREGEELRNVGTP